MRIGKITAKRGLKLHYLPNYQSPAVTAMPLGAEVKIIGSTENGMLELIYLGARGYASPDYIREREWKPDGFIYWIAFSIGLPLLFLIAICWALLGGGA